MVKDLVKLLLLMEMIVVNKSQQNVIAIVQGSVAGVVRQGYVSYYGIPYASLQPDRKFKRAGLAPSWSGVREVWTCSDSNEECLQLEVHVPSTETSPWPVLVWISNGEGPYDPGTLVKEDIIVVLVRYRTGPNGFLCMENESVPGNAGAKDVVLALRWVSDNIVAFRGNPAKVIVAGQGFGAAIAESLTLSPMSQDLFHGIILQSGTILNPSSFNYDAEERAQALAEKLNSNDDIKALRNASYTKLNELSEDLEYPYYAFAMCEENPYNNEERFLFEPPHLQMSNGKINRVPVMMGFNSNEGYNFAANLQEAQVLRRMKNDMSLILPDELSFISDFEVQGAVEKLQKIYFGEMITMASVLTYLRDAYFLSHVHRSVRMRSSSSPLYYYQFSYSGVRGVEPMAGVLKDGAAHGDELAYLFPGDVSSLDGEEGNTEGLIVKLWTNFVKYLNPTPPGSSVTWEPVSGQDIRLLDIGSSVEMKPFPYKAAIDEWEELYDKYYYKRQRG